MTSIYSKQEALDVLNELEGDDWEITIKKRKRTRTPTQNKTIHKYFELLADALNDAGWYQMQFMQAMKTGAQIPWTPEAIKELWRKVQLPLTNVESTARLTTAQVNDVYELFSANVANVSGVSVDFPHR